MLLYILGLSALSGILMISVSVIFFKTDIRLYWKEIAMFALLQMTVFTYTPYVFIWWNDFAAGNGISVYVFYLFAPLIYAPVLLYDYILYPLLFVLFKRKQQDRHCSQILHEAGVAAEVIVVDGLKNAYAMGTGKAAAVVIGKELVDRMSPDELKGILFHEAAHLKFHHMSVLLIIEILKIYVFCFVSYVSFKLSGGNPYVFIPAIGVAGGLMAYARMLMRICEKQADLFAAGMVGPDKYTLALRLLNDITGNKMNNFDIEHPKLEKRIEYIADAFERR